MRAHATQEPLSWLSHLPVRKGRRKDGRQDVYGSERDSFVHVESGSCRKRSLTARQRTENRELVIPPKRDTPVGMTERFYHGPVFVSSGIRVDIRWPRRSDVNVARLPARGDDRSPQRIDCVSQHTGVSGRVKQGPNEISADQYHETQQNGCE
jgi:hypothetical protein